MVTSFPQQEYYEPAGGRCGVVDRDKQALVTIYDWSDDHKDVAVELLAKAERMGRALKQLLPE